jgi:septal ring factor EnvC (AmiA/AmiB activator)
MEMADIAREDTRERMKKAKEMEKRKARAEVIRTRRDRLYTAGAKELENPVGMVRRGLAAPVDGVVVVPIPRHEV